MHLYELAILGSVTQQERETLTKTLQSQIADFDLRLEIDVPVYDGATILRRSVWDRRIAFAAVYFCGSDKSADSVALELAIQSHAPIIPTISSTMEFGNIPDVIKSLNAIRRRADDPDMIELATALLESVGLLRRQRRVFISYRRADSRASALQLHDLLSARGFDAFLDTHGIRPGDRFQDVLWHRLVDSDVVLMLDTPTYFESRWTREEFGRACAKEIQILRVVWPGHMPTRLTDRAETIRLSGSDLHNREGPIRDAVAEKIVLSVEGLRSRSIAARYVSITGKFKAEAEKIGATLEGIGAFRSIVVRLPDDRKIWAYPIVGIPTAETLNDIAEKARQADQGLAPILIYDHVGITESWIRHLRWLDENIKAVRAIKVAEAGWQLAALEGK